VESGDSSIGTLLGVVVMPTGLPGIRQRRLFKGWEEACRVFWCKAKKIPILRELIGDCAELLLTPNPI
jgi:hypothetical protein